MAARVADQNRRSAATAGPTFPILSTGIAPFVSRFARPRAHDAHHAQDARRKRGGTTATASAALPTIVLTGCMTGQRPSFEWTEPLPTATGNADIDAVLERLDSV